MHNDFLDTLTHVGAYVLGAGVFLEDGCYKGKELVAIYLPESLLALVKVDDGKLESKVVEKKGKKEKKDA